ncbi:MAG: hypothetical protein WC718_02875 [Phycisphaerales bacterium]|jgi:hypothetical protein
MEHRLSPKVKSRAKLAVVLVLLGAAGAVAASHLRGAGAVGEEDLSLWFYDESEHSLYAAPRATLPPDRGIGGQTGDGVLAIVVAPRGKTSDAASRRIAYLQKYTPELYKLLSDIRAARANGEIYDGPLQSRGNFMQDNTLVRRENEAEWYSMSSAQGTRVITEWKEWPSPDGRGLIVCTP